MLNFKGMRFPIDVILACIRWYASYPLSYRHLEEMMEERGVSVDHSSINRWAIRFLPLIEKMARKHKRPVGGSWRMDETSIKVKNVWKYLYRAVDEQGKTVDFLLTAKRNMGEAKRYFDKAMEANGDPDKVAMDKSGANKAAIDAINVRRDGPIVVRQVKYLNNIIEQAHRAIKTMTRPMLNFKSFRSAASVLAGIELMHMIRKGQFAFNGTAAMSLANQFLLWQGWSVPHEGTLLFQEKSVVGSTTRQNRSAEPVTLGDFPLGAHGCREQSKGHLVLHCSVPAVYAARSRRPGAYPCADLGVYRVHPALAPVLCGGYRLAQAPCDAKCGPVTPGQARDCGDFHGHGRRAADRAASTVADFVDPRYWQRAGRAVR